MTNHERRNSVALDDAFNYCVKLQSRLEQPELHKVCSAIRTLDRALQIHQESPIPTNLTTDVWSRVRDQMFNVLISSFEGQFEICDGDGNAVDTSCPFPSSGMVNFLPDDIKRRSDSYSSSLDRLSSSIATALRWCFADNRQFLRPEDFGEIEQPLVNEDESNQATSLLTHMYEICQEQAVEGKKKAHRRWWQLYWEASSCPNKQEKNQLRKQMASLEGVWGKPAKQ